MLIKNIKGIKKPTNIDFFDEKTLEDHRMDNIPSLNLSAKKQKTALSRRGLGILTSRASLYGTYLAVFMSLIMLLVYHHLSAFLPILVAGGCVATRVFMMRFFAEFARWENEFGKKHKYAISSTCEIVANMIWLIAISLCGGINLIGYFFAVVFCLMSVASGFAQLIYFVKMNEIEIA